MASQADGLAALLRSLHMRPQVPPQLPGHVRHACTRTAPWSRAASSASPEAAFALDDIGVSTSTKAASRQVSKWTSRLVARTRVRQQLGACAAAVYQRGGPAARHVAPQRPQLHLRRPPHDAAQHDHALRRCMRAVPARQPRWHTGPPQDQLLGPHVGAVHGKARKEP